MALSRTASVSVFRCGENVSKVSFILPLSDDLSHSSEQGTNSELRLSLEIPKREKQSKTRQVLTTLEDWQWKGCLRLKPGKVMWEKLLQRRKKQGAAHMRCLNFWRTNLRGTTK